jgi:hypothetical protein
VLSGRILKEIAREVRFRSAALTETTALALRGSATRWTTTGSESSPALCFAVSIGSGLPVIRERRALSGGTAYGKCSPLRPPQALIEPFNEPSANTVGASVRQRCFPPASVLFVLDDREIRVPQFANSAELQQFA